MRYASQRPAVAGFRFGEMSRLLLYVAEVVVSFRVTRHRAQRHPDQSGAVIAVAALVTQDSQEMQGVGLARLHLQGTSIASLGFVETTCLMRFDCLPHRIHHAMRQILAVATASDPASG
jgi:hypothetical protein